MTPGMSGPTSYTSNLAYAGITPAAGGSGMYGAGGFGAPPAAGPSGGDGALNDVISRLNPIHLPRSSAQDPAAALASWLDTATGNDSVSSTSSIYERNRNMLVESTRASSSYSAADTMDAQAVGAKRKVRALVRQLQPKGAARPPWNVTAQACASIASLIGSEEETIAAEACEGFEAEGGLLSLMEVLDSSKDMPVLQAGMALLTEFVGTGKRALEAMCMLGGVPLLCALTSQQWPAAVRTTAASLVRELCFNSDATLQLLVLCQGRLSMA